MEFSSLIDQYHDALQAKYRLTAFTRVICAPSRQSLSAGHQKAGELFVKCSRLRSRVNGGLYPVDTAVAHSVRITKPRFGWIGSKTKLLPVEYLYGDVYDPL